MKGRQIPLSVKIGLPAPSGDCEKRAYSRGFQTIAGLDEAGRGPLAGPVVAAAVVLPRGFSHPSIRDSKLLSSKQRESLAPCIKEKAVAWGLGVVEAEDIDRINILNASLLAMAYALREIEPLPDYLLIDGTQAIPVHYLTAEGFSPHAVPFQKPVPKGDRLCLSIAAASIIAKVARDEIMIRMDEVYPEYGFASHKGYGSPAHLSALKRYGPLPIHRRSFKPVRETCAGHRVAPPTLIF